jgi:TP901 family phage tail tape measure protein
VAKSGTLTVKVLGDAGPFQKTMGGLGPMAGKAFAAVGIAAAAGAAKAMTSFVGFERQMNEVFTLLPGISQDAMGEMTDQVKGFSKEFGVLPDKVVPALYQSLSAGVPKDNVFEFLETAQKAAKGGVTDITTAVDGISSVVNAYGSEIVDATQASDLMFTAVRLGKTNFEQLSASLSNVTPIASGLGVSFEDVSAALASMTAKGTPTAQATTQLRSLFVELSKAGGKTAKTFEDMAGKSFQEFIAAGGNTSEALDIMKKAADESGVELQDLFGSVEAGAAALSLASGTSFADNIAEMGDAAGATDAAFDQMMTGLGPVIDRLKAFAAVAMIEIGQKLAPVLMGAMTRVGEAFAIVSDWWNTNSPVILGKIGEVRSAIMAWIDEVRPAIESWVTNVLGSVTTWWEANGPTIIALAEDLRAGIATAIDGIVTAVQFVVDEWDKFKVAIGVAVAIMIPHFVALAVSSVVNSAIVVASWVATHVQAMASAVIHSAQVVIMIAKWVALAVASVAQAAIVVASWVATGVAAVAAAVVQTAQVAVMVAKWIALGVVATAQAAVVAAAWVISMGPIALVVAAVAGLAVAFVKNWETIRSAVLTGVMFVVDKFLFLVEKVVGAAASAFGWVKGIGPKLEEAAQAVARFREDVNAELAAIRDKTVNVRIVRHDVTISSTRGGAAMTGPSAFHAGGIVRADRAGGDVLIRARDGERVSTPTEPDHGTGMPDPDAWGRQAARSYSAEMRRLARAG